jgi:hypothetical protein
MTGVGYGARLGVVLAVLFNDRVSRESQPSLFLILEVPRLPPVGVWLRILPDQGSLRLDERQRGEAHFFCGVGDVGWAFAPFDGATKPAEPPIKQVQLSIRF